VILLTPHFVGLEAPLFRISMDYPWLRCYSRQKGSAVRAAHDLGRTRFGARLFPRQASVREKPARNRPGRDLLLSSRSRFRAPALGVRAFFGVPAATGADCRILRAHRCERRAVP